VKLIEPKAALQQHSAGPNTRISAEAKNRFAGARILVLDDDCTHRKVAAMSLAERGYRVHQAASGAHLKVVLETIALNAWPEHGVELMAIDLDLLSFDGFDAVRALRAAGDNTPVLLMTAFPEARTRERAAALGMPLLAKPFDMKVLFDMVEQLLSGAPADCLQYSQSQQRGAPS
jgi:DNA-binding response OmpR family regulator